MEINIAICDDCVAFIHEIEYIIMQYQNNYKKTIKIHSFVSGESLISSIKANYIPDIVFLDIDLNENKLGTNIGKEIKKINPNILLIYISGYTCYYKELVVSEPFSFIEKPLDPESVVYVLQTAIDRLYYLKEKFLFTYKSNRVFNKIDLKDVIYFESQHRIINTYMKTDEIISFYEKLDNIENQVEDIYPYFLRINKSYYVNYYYIDKHSSSFITIKNINIKIGSKYKKKYQEKMHILL